MQYNTSRHQDINPAWGKPTRLNIQSSIVNIQLFEVMTYEQKN